MGGPTGQVAIRRAAAQPRGYPSLLEEHFAINEMLMDSAGFVPDDHWPELRSRILDIHEQRLRLMDQHGMEMMLLSLRRATLMARTLRDARLCTPYAPENETPKKAR